MEGFKSWATQTIVPGLNPLLKRHHRAEWLRQIQHRRLRDCCGPGSSRTSSTLKHSVEESASAVKSAEEGAVSLTSQYEELLKNLDEKESDYQGILAGKSSVNEEECLEDQLGSCAGVGGGAKVEMDGVVARLLKVRDSSTMLYSITMAATVGKLYNLVVDTENTREQRYKMETYKEEKLDENKETQVTGVKVHNVFGSMSPTLLPGTTAKLEPPEGCSFLDGLEVRVAFGGVWKQSLSEMSGGLQSLLALSLILVLLLFKPAPLYRLDEVDAALDLSHTENIGRMIKNHFLNSQFIVVSLKVGVFSSLRYLWMVFPQTTARLHPSRASDLNFHGSSKPQIVCLHDTEFNS
ncbi:hypothetical protein NL676_016301 [Syzygium grande]|nr:hypothetical protein NL676_016301 [Syzygium grande]